MDSLTVLISAKKREQNHAEEFAWYCDTHGIAYRNLVGTVDGDPHHCKCTIYITIAGHSEIKLISACGMDIKQALQSASAAALEILRDCV